MTDEFQSVLRTVRAMNKLSTRRFVISAILLSLGWFLILWNEPFASAFFLAAWFFVFPREQLHRVVRRRELLSLVFFLVAFIGVLIALKFLVPASGDRALERFLRHPAVVVPLWLLNLGLGYWVWRRTHNASSVEPSEHRVS